MKELLETGVNLPLEYIASENALIGQIKGYSVAVKENNETGSYGVLIWAKEGKFSAITKAQDYLADRVSAENGFVKNFRVTDRGIAVALKKDDNDFTNVTNLKRFLYDFASNLSLNFYENCCNECGATDGLSVYASGGTVVQCCGDCGKKYNLLKSFGSSSQPSVNAAAVAPVPAPKLSDEEEFRNLFATENTAPVSEPAPAKNEAAEDVDISGLMVGADEPQEYKPPRSALFEEAQREFELEKARETEKTAETGFEQFMLSESAPSADSNVTVVEEDKSPVGHSDEFAVTDIVNDENEGEDIEVTEIESLIEKPTETTGHKQLDAEETPLDENGKVPLVNPNSECNTAVPSDPFGPDAVQPSEYVKPMPIFDEANAKPDDSPFEDIRGEGVKEVPGYDNSGDDPRADFYEAPTTPRPVMQNTAQNGVASMPYSQQTANPQPVPYASAASYRPILPESSNALFGIIGALVFAFLGVLLWVGIYQLGYISYLGAVAITAAVFFGYRIAGGEMDVKGVVISIVLSLVTNLIGHGVCLVFDTQTAVYENFGYHISFFEGIEWLLYTMGDSSVMSTIGIDIFFNVAVSIISIVVIARAMIKGR